MGEDSQKNSLSLEKINQYVEKDITLDNTLEEDLLRHLPAIRDIISEGQDVTSSFRALSNTLGSSMKKFEKLYNAAQKEMQLQAQARSGPDERYQHIHELDEEIIRLKKERNDIVNTRSSAIAKVDEAKKNGTDPDLSIHEAGIAFMKFADYQRTLRSIDQLINKLNTDKAKAMGIYERKEDPTANKAAAFMKMLYDNKVMNPNIIDAEFVEIKDDTGLQSINDDE